MEFNINSWYRLTSAAAMSSQLSMVGTFPYLEGSEGLVTYGTSDNSMPGQQWQFFPIGNSTYMLRTKSSGPTGFLSTKVVNDTNMQTIPRIYSGSPRDSEMIWKVLPWGDGTFYVSNEVHGEERRLDFAVTGRMKMSGGIKQHQAAQAFSFVQLQEINDHAFSTVRTPLLSSATATASPTRSRTRAPEATSSTSTGSMSLYLTPTRSPAPFVSTMTTPTESATSQARSQPHGLSIPASMGIGVTIGVAGLVFFTLMAMVLYHKMKRRRSPEELHRRQEKMWKGFAPQYRDSLDSSRSIVRPKTICGGELPVPSPAVFSPTPHGSPVSPFVPQYTAFSPLVELPV